MVLSVLEANVERWVRGSEQRETTTNRMKVNVEGTVKPNPGKLHKRATDRARKSPGISRIT